MGRGLCWAVGGLAAYTCSVSPLSWGHSTETFCAFYAVCCPVTRLTRLALYDGGFVEALGFGNALFDDIAALICRHFG